MLDKLKQNYKYPNYMDSEVLNEIYYILQNIESDLESEYDALKESVIEIIGKIVESNGKKELYRYLTQLSIVEYKTREFKFSRRDHVIHALLTFITGIYINEFFMIQHSSHVDSFRWKLTSLFHDIGYASSISNELAYQQTKTMYEVINKLTNRHLSKEIVDYYDVYSHLNQDKNAFNIIYDRLKAWDLDVEVIDNYVKNEEKLDHGIMSSLILLYTIDQVYQAHNPERKYGNFYVEVRIAEENFYLNCSQDIFDGDIIDACAAIFVHNLPEKCFESKKINLTKAKLAYLLKLSDELQDWNRTVFQNNYSNPSEQYDLNVIDNRLLVRIMEDFSTKINKYLAPQDLIVVDNSLT